MATSISIVIPSFNQGRFLDEAIRSVVDQDWVETELLVVDGGSTDETPEVLQRWKSKISWWVSEPDDGQAAAVNKGLKRCTGDLVAFIGADDVYLPGAFNDAAKKFSEHPDAGAFVGGFVRIDEQSCVISEPVAAVYPWTSPMDLMLADAGSWRLHQVSTFYSRRVLDRVGRSVDENLEYTMDRELLNRVCREYQVVTSPKVYAAFRHHASSKSTSEILPFSRELAALHLRDAPSDEAHEILRRRRVLARRQLGAGYLKLARAEGPGLRALCALTVVPFVSPRLALTRTYGTRWLEASGVASPARRLLRKSPSPVPKPRPLSEVAHEL